MFEFAVSRQLISRNPASAMFKKPSAEASREILAFDDADLKVMFESPMYRGHSGRIDGNRDKPGEVITRDDRYWLPVVALATGMRLEELSSLKRSEVIREGDIVAFDLRDRPLTGINRLKNRMSKRLIPVSATLEATGFVEWALAGEGEYVFAGLKPDGKGKRGTKFGAWFARWTEANAPVKGQGIDDPDKPFHSMRHTFKRLARQSPVKEEISDLITGHTDGNAVARSYGRGVDLATLKAAIDQIEIAPLKAIQP
jgi:integrase